MGEIKYVVHKDLNDNLPAPATGCDRVERDATTCRRACGLFNAKRCST